MVEVPDIVIRVVLENSCLTALTTLTWMILPLSTVHEGSLNGLTRLKTM